MYEMLVLPVYAVIMVAITLLFTKKQTTAEGFLLGNRTFGTAFTALSVAKVWIWAPALFVSAERAFVNGWVGLFWFLVPNVLCLILFIPFAKRIRKQMPEGYTLSGYMGEKYQSKKVKGMYLFQLGALSVMSTAVQLFAGGRIISTLTGIPFMLVVVILASIAFAYAQFSGLKASVLTNAVQMIFMLCVCAGLVFGALSGAGISDALIRGLTGRSGEFTSLFSGSGIDILLGFGLPTTVGLLSGPFGDQNFWQRAFAVKKDRIGKSFGIGAVLFGLVPLSLGILGFIVAGLQLDIADTGMTNLAAIQHLFSPWVIIPFLFLIAAGLLSTVDANLCTTAALANDTQKKYSNVISKLSMVGALIIAVLIAWIPGITVMHLFLMYGTFRASSMLPTILTLKGVKFTQNGIFYGILCALIIGLPIFAYGNIFNVAVLRTVGSLTTVFTSAIAAFVISRREVRKNAISH